MFHFSARVASSSSDDDVRETTSAPACEVGACFLLSLLSLLCALVTACATGKKRANARHVIIVWSSERTTEDSDQCVPESRVMMRTVLFVRCRFRRCSFRSGFDCGCQPDLQSQVNVKSGREKLSAAFFLL